MVNFAPMLTTAHDQAAAGRGRVVVAVPVYRPLPTPYEAHSLRRAAEVLGVRRPIVLVAPENLDLAPYRELMPGAGEERFGPAYFRNIAGYNRLMLSEDFYTRFGAYDYVLICQPDVWMFADRLDRWLDAGWDYVGAPWLIRPVYRLWPLRLGSWIKHTARRLAGLPDARVTDWRTGNGGLSLRRTAACRRAVGELRAQAEDYLSHPGCHLYNEDVFFSVEVPRMMSGFRIPSWQEALDFAFDKYPSLCRRLNGGRLPMGAHGWYKRRMIGQWRGIIPDPPAANDNSQT